jgi:hypothetical protein
MFGRIKEEAFTTDTSKSNPDPCEEARRKMGATGTPITLADGQTWLLANPSYQPLRDGVTMPCIDSALDRIFESTILDEGLKLTDLWEVANELLSKNYRLTTIELGKLLSVSPGAESRSFASSILDALFASDQSERSYTAWVRASLLANGLSETKVPAQDLLNVLTILVATNRTMPLSKFVDACRLLEERSRLETLI